MKTVFDNAMTAHVWAQQNQSHGRSHNGNLSFSGATIYSYGRHFPIATFFNGAILFNNDHYSVSTSGHQNDVRHAVNDQRDNLIYVDTKTIKAFVDDWSETKNTALNVALEQTLKAISKNVDSAAKRRKADLKHADISAAASAIIRYHKLLNLVRPGNDSLPPLLAEWQERLHGDIDALITTRAAEIKAAEAKAKKERDERDAENKRKAEEYKARWLAGEDVGVNAYRYVLPDIVMRIKGDKIETSHGAEFPISHGKKAFEYIRMVKDGKKSYADARGIGYAPSRKIQLGHFKIDAIGENGDVKAGCHFVKWDEIERIARILNIYP